MSSGSPCPMLIGMEIPSCPDCAAPIPPWGPPFCQNCRLPLTGPAAEELWHVDLTIKQLAASLTGLTARRETLVHWLQAERAQRAQAPPVEHPRPAQTAQAPQPHYLWPLDGGTQAPAATWDLSRFAVRNLLLALGAALLGISAVVFTIVSWGQLTLITRAAILLALTTVALAAPWPLVRRGLSATGEAVAAVGLVLIGLQCYAVYSYGLVGHPDPRWYATVAAGLVTAGWAGYAWAAPIRLPRPTVIALAQLPLPLAAFALRTTPTGFALALMMTAALDLAIVLRTNDRLMRPTALGAGALTGLIGTTTALVTCVVTGSPRAAAVLAMSTAVALVWAWKLVPPVAGVAGLSMAGALAGPVAMALGEAWAVGAYAVAAVIVLVATATLPMRLRPSAALSGAAVLGMTGVWVLPNTVVALAGPLDWAVWPWPSHGAPSGAREALIWTGSPATPLVLTLIAAVVTVGASGLVREIRAAAALILSISAVVALPAAADLPYPVTLALLLALAAALLAVAATATDARAATIAAAYATGHALLWSLAEPYATVTVLAIACALLIGTAITARTAVARVVTAADAVLTAGGLVRAVWAVNDWPLVSYALVAVAALALLASRRARPEQRTALELAAAVVTLGALGTADQTGTLAVTLGLTALLAAWSTRDQAVRVVRDGAALVATLTFGGFAAAAGLAAGLPAHHAAFGVLAAAGLIALAAAFVRWGVIEAGGYLAAGAGVAMAAPDARLLSLAVALAGVLALGVCVRSDRRPAVWVGGALLQVALWIRLGAAGVHAPEAYTIPVTVTGLLFGRLRHRRGPSISSWPAYGPALTATLLPSLIVAWHDPGWPRPLLLGLAALAITLAGAWFRLRAPALLGGSVLLLVAGHELAPAVAQLVGLVPRWLPIALVGLGLLLVGATYERRLRDLRRLRDAVAHLQ